MCSSSPGQLLKYYGPQRYFPSSKALTMMFTFRTAGGSVNTIFQWIWEGSATWAGPSELFHLITSVIVTKRIFLTFCLYSVISNAVTLWIVACQNSLSLGFFQERILEWVAISSSRGSSLPRDQTCVTASPTLQVNSLPLSHRGSLPYIHIGFNRELSQ